MECLTAYDCIANNQLNRHITVSDSSDRAVAQGCNALVRDAQKCSLRDFRCVAGYADAVDGHLKA